MIGKARTTSFGKSFTLSVLLTASILLPLIMFSCKEKSNPVSSGGNKPATLNGKVYGKLVTGQVQLQVGATVVMTATSPADTETVQTDSTGYHFSLPIADSLTSRTVSLALSKGAPFKSANVAAFTVTPGKVYTRSDTLKDTTSIPSGGAGGGKVASLVFISSTGPFANVHGVGGVENVSFTFEARDSLGLRVDPLHRAHVRFTLVDSTGGGEFLTPTLDSSGISGSLSGRIVTTLNTGNKTGIAEILATLVNFVGGVWVNTNVTATSPAFPIFGGPPDPAHVSIGADKINFPALGLIGSQSKISVQIGDKAGNPVRSGTLVLFSTTAGLISPLDSTDDAGHATATLTSGSPQPANGFDVITAQTTGDSGKIVQKSITLLWSGPPIIDSLKGTDTTFTVRSGGALGVTYRVYDSKAHPLAQGTQITASVIGDAASRLAVSGDLNAILPDTQDSSYTSFHLQIQDTSLTPPAVDKQFYIVLNVTGPNGTVQKIQAGSLRGSQGGPGIIGKPASIVLASVTPPLISVKGSGGQASAVVTYLVMDRNGRTVPLNSALVTFKLAGLAGVTLFPDSIRTDGQGRVQTTLTSGTQAGVVQVVASTDTGGGNLVSSNPVPITVAGGLPDSAHFTLAVAKLNVPGLLFAGLTDVVSAYVGDKYANPVQDNSAIYFTTSGGITTPTGLTKTGVTSTTLITGNPPPVGGIDTVTATTMNKDSVRISQTARVIFSGAPIIQAPDSVYVNDGQTVPLAFRVVDFNNNPMSSGTSISAALDADQSILKSFLLTGDLSTNLGDNFFGGARVTDFALVLRDTIVGDLTQGPFRLIISENGPNGPATKIMHGILRPSLNPNIQSIFLVSVGDRRLNVKGTGIDSSIFVYGMQDNQGRPILAKNVPVDFSSTGAVGSFTPARAFTDSLGHATSIFYTGTDTGSVSVVAQAGTIFSTPQNLTILSGPPVTLHMTLDRPPDTTKKVNFPGGALTTSDKIGEARVYVTDLYGNPIAPGSQVNFVTNGGKINASGFTDRNGFTRVDWYGGNPPPPATGGVATVKATIGPAVDSASVVYSGSPAVTLPALPNPLRHGIDTVLTFRIKDANGNPMAAGTTVKLTLSGSASGYYVVSGDTTLPDTRDTNFTYINYHLQDTNTVVSDVRNLTLTLQVNGPNGFKQLVNSINVTGAAPPPFGILSLVGLGTNRLSVKGVGKPDTVTSLTYELEDSSHRAVKTPGIQVLFRFFGVAGKFDSLTATTDANGRVTNNFYSDIIAETAKVQGVAQGIASSLQNIVVDGGPPFKDYFTFRVTIPPDSLAKVNFPGGAEVGQNIGEAIVQVRDRYGNVVPVGTPISFRSTGGVITGIAYTDGSGTAVATWRGGSPVPANGVAMVAATAQGDPGLVGDSTRTGVIYSGPANILGGFAGPQVFAHGYNSDVNYTVTDTSVNGYPLAQGTTIAVSLTGLGAGSFVLTGDTRIVLPDTRIKGTGTTSFTFHMRDTSTVTYSAQPVTVLIQVTGPNGIFTQQTANTLQGAPPPIVYNPTVVSVNLVSETNSRVTVSNVGETETSLLTFEIRDSLGHTIPRQGEAIRFVSFGVPGTFTPDTALTNAAGQVQTMFRSGTLAGSVDIEAIDIVKGINSAPTKLTVVGGPPDQSHLTVMLTQFFDDPKAANVHPIPQLNFPGAYKLNQIIGQGRVLVGDKYSNPVPAGTQVYFASNAGVIFGVDQCDSLGLAAADWEGGNPLPTKGIAFVRASAVGQGGVLVIDSASAVFSGQAIITGGLSNNFIMRAGIDTIVTYRVADANGNPLSAGATIQVSTIGTSAPVLTGDVNVTMLDTKDTNATKFSVHIRDTNTTITGGRSLSMNIQVGGVSGTNPNGTAVQEASGTVQGILQTGGRTRLPGSIALLSAVPTDIQVIGTGGTETSALTFEIRDSLGVPVDSSYKVRFSLNSSPSGTFISPDSGLSDLLSGRIGATVHAGTVAGVVQIVATVVTPTTLITSTPVLLVVHAGLPDSTHFSVNTSRLNVPGQDIDNQTATIGVIVGDKYANPVATNTAIYFTTRIGIIDGSAFTAADGTAAATLRSADPRSANGFGFAIARTTGVNGAVVQDSVRILFSGVPQLGNLSAGAFAVPAGGSSPAITFTLHDENGNPLAQGTAITVTLQYTPPPNSQINLVAQGDVNVVLGDTQVAGPGTTQFSFRVADQTSGGVPSQIPATVVIHVTSPNGNPADIQISGTIG